MAVSFVLKLLNIKWWNSQPTLLDERSEDQYLAKFIQMQVTVSIWMVVVYEIQ
jgi:hypothetical protein